MLTSFLFHKLEARKEISSKSLKEKEIAIEREEEREKERERERKKQNFKDRKEESNRKSTKIKTGWRRKWFLLSLSFFPSIAAF